MDVAKLLNAIGAAVADAKKQAEGIDKMKGELAAITAERQAAIDKAQEEYAKAKDKADQLQAEGRQTIEAILPAADPRFRQSK